MVDLKVYYHSSEHMDEVPDESIHRCEKHGGNR